MQVLSFYCNFLTICLRMPRIGRAAPADALFESASLKPAVRLESCVKKTRRTVRERLARNVVLFTSFFSKKWRLRSDSNRRDTASGAANRATHGCIWPLCHGGIKNPAHVTRGKRRKTETSEKNKSLLIPEKCRKSDIFSKKHSLIFLCYVSYNGQSSFFPSLF